MGTGQPSPILQLDGEVQVEVVKFSFKSTYHMDDINEPLSETFLESEVNFTLETRVKVASVSARDLYVIRSAYYRTTEKERPGGCV